MAHKRIGPGRPRKDDSEAIEHVRTTCLGNQRIGYREAARRYFRAHPDKLGNVKLESAARRVANKALEADGRRVRRPDAEALELTAFRLNIIAQDLHRMVTRLKGELPANANRKERRGPNLAVAIISMEEILEEIKRLRFDDPE